MRDSSQDSIKAPRRRPLLPRFADDSQTITERLNYLFPDDENQASVENNTHHGRKLEKRRKKLDNEVTLCDPGDPAKKAKLSDFYESSHFLVDTLKDEFCTKEEQGWFQLSNPSPPEEEAQEEAGMKVVPVLATGKWRPAEHQLFLEALKIHGKDWEKIQQHVGTRDLSMVQSHAQKFLIRLVKFLDGKTRISKMTFEEAEFYYGTLNQKLNRWMKKGPAQSVEKSVEKLEETMAAPDSVKTSQTRYEKWKESIIPSQKSDHSLGHSVRIMIQKSEGGSNRIKFSIKSAFIEGPLPDVEVMSDSSFKYPYPDSYGSLQCTHSTPELKPVTQIHNVLSLMEDIDSDDEEPEIEMLVKEAGLRFHLFSNITALTYMKCFFIPQKHQLYDRLPNFCRYIKQNVSQIMEAQDSLQSLNGVVPLRYHQYDRFASIDLTLAREYAERPAIEQFSDISVRYRSKHRATEEKVPPGAPIYFPLTQKMIEHFRRLEQRPIEERIVSVRKLVKEQGCLECLKEQRDRVAAIHEGILECKLKEGLFSDLFGKAKA